MSLRCLAAPEGLLDDRRRRVSASAIVAHTVGTPGSLSNSPPHTTHEVHHHFHKPRLNTNVFLISYSSYPRNHRRRKPRSGRERLRDP